MRTSKGALDHDGAAGLVGARHSHELAGGPITYDTHQPLKRPGWSHER